MKQRTDILLRFYSILMWLWFLVSSILLTPVLFLLWLLTFFFDRNLRILHLFSCFWGAHYIWVNVLWSLKITDRHKFDKRRLFLIISNHQSLVDIVVIYSLFKHFRWTSKSENFSLPFVGWVLAMNRSVKIYRGRRRAFELFHQQVGREVKRGNSVFLFPEGSRSPDGKLRNFKEGGFRIAHDFQLDILPMVLDGTGDAVPKKGWSLTGRQKMILKVLDPVPWESYKNLSPSETKKMFHSLISSELDKFRRAE